MGKEILPVRRGTPLGNARHEMVAQHVAGGETNIVAWIRGFHRELKNEIERIEFQKKMTQGQKNVCSRVCNRPEVKARVRAIMTEQNDRFMSIREGTFPMTKAGVMEALWVNFQKASAIIPCTDARGNVIGTFKSDYKAANSTLELMGGELGMFVKQHKHLHQNSNPLEGGRTEILGSLRVLTDQLSDADLRELGLQRTDVVEASSRRTNGTGDEPEQTLPPLS